MEDRYLNYKKENNTEDREKGLKTEDEEEEKRI